MERKRKEERKALEEDCILTDDDLKAIKETHEEIKKGRIVRLI